MAKHESIDAFRETTGLPINTYFSVVKMQWLIENVEAVQKAKEAGTLCLGTIDSWLIFKMTGEFKTDSSNASRTFLMNINTLEWD